MIGWALAANPHVFIRSTACLNSHPQQRLYRWVALIEGFGDEAGITIQPERELRKIIGANGKTVEVLQELIRQQRIGGDFTHHD